MKDCNFIEINNDLNRSLIDFPEAKICSLQESIHFDSIFLRDHNLMDYSLLLIIEAVSHLDDVQQQSTSDDGEAQQELTRTGVTNRIRSSIYRTSRQTK